MKLYLIRHGEPDYSRDCLTDLGKKQANAMGETLKDIPFKTIYVSTHGRAEETSLPLCNAVGIKKLIFAPWAREDTGALYFGSNDVDPNTGERVWTWVFWHPAWKDKLFSKEAFDLGQNWFEHPYFKDTKLKEGVMKMRKDSDVFLRKLGFEHHREKEEYVRLKDKTPDYIALVAHGGFAFSFLSAILDIPYNVFTRDYGCMDFTAYTIVEFEDGKKGTTCKPKLISYNNFDHIKGVK